MKSLLRQNIHNLTALWHAYGADKSGSLCKNISWPNRVWTNKVNGIIENLDLQNLKGVTEKNTFAVWSPKKDTSNSVYSTNIEFLSKTQNWRSESKLYCMSLALARWTLDKKDSNSLIRVASSNQSQLTTFTHVCSDGFGYRIDPNVILSVARHPCVSIYLLYVNQQAVATALTYSSSEVFGLFQIAVPEQQRGKGYAKQVTIELLNIAKQQGYKIATLQASLMGRSLYAKLGFREDGLLHLFKPSTI